MLPRLSEMFLHKIIFLNSLHAQVGLNHFLSKLFGLILRNEELAVWLSAIGHTLCGELFQNILCEKINMVIIFRIEVFWDLSLVSVLPLAVIVIISDEAVEVGLESFKVRLGFLNFTDLNPSSLIWWLPWGFDSS